VTEDDRKEPLGIGARASEFVGVTDSGGFDLDENFTRLGPIEFNVFRSPEVCPPS